MLLFLIIWYRSIRFLKRLTKVSLYCFVLLFILFQFKPIQNYAAQYAIRYLYEKTGNKIEIEYVYLNWFNSFTLKNINLYDESNNEMVSAEKIAIRFNIIDLIFSQNLRIRGVWLYHANINLVQDDLGLNLQHFIDKLSSDANPSESATIVDLDRIVIKNSRFALNNESDQQSYPRGQFNPNQIRFDSIDADIYKFRLQSDSILLDVEEFSGFEINSGIKINRLKSDVLICKKSFIFDKLIMLTNQSRIQDKISFYYTEYKDFSNFFEKVSIDFNFSNAVIDSKDIQPFAQVLEKYPFRVELSGSFTGKAREISCRDFSLCMGNETYLSGNIELRNIDNPQNTIFIFDFEKSQVDTKDILSFFPESSRNYVSSLGKIQFTSDFYGAFSDFITDGVFQTDIGLIQADFELKGGYHGGYEGSINCSEFDLGIFLQIPSLGKMNFSSQIMGSGFDLLIKDSIEAYIDLTAFEFMNYRYRNTFAAFKFGKNTFEGKIVAADTNLRLSFDGKVSLADSTFDFTAKFDTINLFPLNLSDKPIVVSCEIDADFRGLNPDKIDGYLKFSNIWSTYENRRFQLKEFFISITDLEKNKKRFTINSDLVRARLEGNNSFSGFAVDATKLFFSYPNYIYEKPTDNSFSYNQYRYSYSIKLIEPDRLTKFINYPLRISNRSELRGEFVMDSVVRFNLNLVSDSISYGSNKLYKPDLWMSLEFDSAKKADPYHFELLFSPHATNFSGFELSKCKITVFNIQNQTLFISELQHKVSYDRFNINGLFEFQNDSLIVVLGRDSEFTLLENLWKSTGNNVLVYDFSNGNIVLDDLMFATQGQVLGFDGKISTDPNDKFSVLVKNFNINALSPYVGAKLDGYANIKASLKDLYGTPFFIFEVQAHQIMMQNFLLGALNSNSYWDSEKSHLAVELNLKNNNQDLVKLKGFLDFNEDADLFHLDMFLEHVPLELMGGFVKDYISGLQGTVLGAVKLRGSPSVPKIKGDIFVSETKFKLNQTNVVYSINDRFSFDENLIKFRNVRFKDELENVCRVDGFIEHQYFNNIKFDLKATLQNFKVYATKQMPYSLFYGTVFMSGTALVKGSADHPELDMDLITERGTRIYMPLETSVQVEEQQDFIRFAKDSAESKIQEEMVERVSLNGFNMKLNLEIGSETFAEIMINKKTGDLIEVYGKGKLSIKTNSNEELEMYGRVEVESGKYRLSFINFISKEFEIRSPSSLSWSGDPLVADLNILAVYRQNIPLIPILEGADSSILKAPEVRRRYPVETILNLKGEMFKPTVSYDIEILDYPPVVLAGGIPFSIDAQVSAFKQSIKNNEQELNRQVFSLIMLKTFSARNTFSGGNFAGGSVGELLANQLSYWVSQVDNNLEVDVDLQGLTREALNSARIRLSYTALGGRIRISREGTVAGQQGQNQSNVSSVVGDWVVEYMVKNDGSLRLKMHHRQNLSAFTNAIGGIGTTTGLSFMHTKSFDLGRRRQRGKKKK